MGSGLFLFFLLWCKRVITEFVRVLYGQWGSSVRVCWSIQYFWHLLENPGISKFPLILFWCIYFLLLSKEISVSFSTIGAVWWLISIFPIVVYYFIGITVPFSFCFGIVFCFLKLTGKGSTSLINQQKAFRKREHIINKPIESLNVNISAMCSW